MNTEKEIQAFQNNSPKHSHYWEAFGKMKQMLIKEMQMATPYNDMAEQKRRKKRNEAIDKIMERFCKRGERDYHEKELIRKWLKLLNINTLKMEIEKVIKKVSEKFITLI